MNLKLFTLTMAALTSQAIFAFSSGPYPRHTAAPGDFSGACTQCHAGTALNGGGGSVSITLPNGPVYTAGVKQHILVQVSDPAQQRWGFQLSARLNSDLNNGQAGILTPTDGNTQIKCGTVSSFAAACNPGDVQFIEHTSAGTRPGTKSGVTFEFDWTPPAAGAGSVTLFVAGNAANGDFNLTGDHIYTSSVQLDPVTPALTVPVTKYVITNLVSDIPGLAAQTDPNLVNPWGIALSPTSPFWIANNGTQTATLYNGQGVLFPPSGPLVIGAGGSATGQVFNGTPAFALQPGAPAAFIFSTEDGFITGWNRTVNATTAQMLYDNSGTGAVYKGLALGANGSGPVLYAANFNAGTIDAFDSNMHPLTTSGGFVDPNLPAGFAPFNVQKFGRSLFVTYAMQDDAKHDDVQGAGNGYINVFDMDGNLRTRLVSGGTLNSPWGMAMAPGFFGDYSGTLLVGNFGDGTINAFDSFNGTWLGALQDASGNPLSVPGMWGLIFGNGQANGGDANTLYFTAGIAGSDSLEGHGLFGSVSIAPAN